MKLKHEISNQGPLMPEQKLWTAVIRRGIADACGEIELSFKQSKKGSLDIQKNAIKWFRYRHKSFLTVCYLAGLDSEVVRGLALNCIKEMSVPHGLGHL
jgi:hypothetical protein